MAIIKFESDLSPEERALKRRADNLIRKNRLERYLALKNYKSRKYGPAVLSRKEAEEIASQQAKNEAELAKEAAETRRITKEATAKMSGAVVPVAPQAAAAVAPAPKAPATSKPEFDEAGEGVPPPGGGLSFVPSQEVEPSDFSLGSEFIPTEFQPKERVAYTPQDVTSFMPEDIFGKRKNPIKPYWV